MKRILAVLLVAFLYLGSWFGNRVQAGGCICGGSTCTAYTTDPNNNLICADPVNQEYCCNACQGGAGCGGNPTVQNGCQPYGLRLVCGTPPVLGCRLSQGGCWGNWATGRVGQPTGDDCNTDHPLSPKHTECQENCWCESLWTCANSPPAAPTLVSPAEGAKLSTTSVNLLWNAPSSWGTACSGANNQYSVYVAWPSTLLATLPAGTTATTFTGTRGTDYAWEVTANNGQLAAGSAWRTFRIMYDQIAGTVYNDPNNTCSQATRWSAGGTISDGSYSSSIAPDGTYSVEGPTGASYNLALALPTGYSCSTGALCGICPVRSGVGSPSTGNLFFITNNKEKWWQAIS